MPTLPTIDTPRLRLRTPAHKDVPALFEILRDAETMRFWSRPPMTDIAEAEAFLLEILEHAAARTLFQWAIARRDDDETIGTCTLFHLEPEHRRAELGYILRRDHWGRGLATEALSALLNHAFDTRGLHRIEADIDPRNARSIRCAVRLGFKLEGRLRERFIVAGETQDSLFYGLLAPEWKSR